jgi:hypothetical protein
VTGLTIFAENLRRWGPILLSAGDERADLTRQFRDKCRLIIYRLRPPD